MSKLGKQGIWTIVLRVVLVVHLLALIALVSFEHSICSKRGGVVVVSMGVPPLVCVAPLREIEP